MAPLPPSRAPLWNGTHLGEPSWPERWGPVCASVSPWVKRVQRGERGGAGRVGASSVGRGGEMGFSSPELNADGPPLRSTQGRTTKPIAGEAPPLGRSPRRRGGGRLPLAGERERGTSRPLPRRHGDSRPHPNAPRPTTRIRSYFSIGRRRVGRGRQASRCHGDPAVRGCLRRPAEVKPRCYRAARLE